MLLGVAWCRRVLPLPRLLDTRDCREHLPVDEHVFEAATVDQLRVGLHLSILCLAVLSTVTLAPILPAMHSSDSRVFPTVRACRLASSSARVFLNPRSGFGHWKSGTSDAVQMTPANKTS